jgi:hypothetical protein
MEGKGMKIIKFMAENIMKLTAMEIVPKDNLVEIRGGNAQGKSSILDCIVMALKGEKEIPQQPIKKGADKGKIILDVGEYKITRSFTKEGSYLKIESADGKTVKSPQKFLDELIGKVSFDPLEFINDPDEKKQRATLLRLIGVDVDALNKKEKQLRDDRTEIGRDVKRLATTLEAIVYHPEVEGQEELKASDVSQQLTTIMEFNQKWDADWTNNESKKQEGADHRKRIEAIQVEIENLQKEANIRLMNIEDLKVSYRTVRDQLEANPKQDITDIQTKIDQIEITNTKIRENATRKSVQTEYELFDASYKSKTTEIEAVETERKTLLASANMPVPGLDVDDNGIIYNGIPLSQCSDGEKLMIGLGISMALNPTMRVLRIKDGSLLDIANRKIIYDQIKDKDFQLWMETVVRSEEDKKVGIYIEDGGVVSIDGEIPPAPKISKQSLPKPKEEGKVKPAAETKVEPAQSKPAVEVPDNW